jgi:hypothetical protein
MAIIYSYTKTNEAYGSDLLVLSRFHGGVNADNGRNYSIDLGTLGAFIADNYAPTLDSVLAAGNESLLNASINYLYLYDASETEYGYIRISDSGLDVVNANGTLVSRIDTGGITIAGPSYGSVILTGTITANRNYTLPNKSGTFAMTSDITNVGSGLYSQVSDSNMVTNTTTKTALTGTGAGTLEVAADTFSIGDSFEINLVGEITCNNSATLRITLENTEGVVFGDTGIMDLSSATGKKWFLDAIFTIRNIGGEGVANVICGGNFSYNVNSGNSSESFSFASGNPNDFDTTINNTLRVFVQWGSATASDKIQSFIFNLNKIF